MKKSELIRAAVDKYLALNMDEFNDDTKRVYICSCLEFYSIKHRDCVEDIKNYVERLLGGRSRTLLDWLLINNHIPDSLYWGIESYRNHTKLQATRKAWAEWIAQQYEAIGD